VTGAAVRPGAIALVPGGPGVGTAIAQAADPAAGPGRWSGVPETVSGWILARVGS
jgi:hypothetical protein